MEFTLDFWLHHEVATEALSNMSIADELSEHSLAGPYMSENVRTPPIH